MNENSELTGAVSLTLHEERPVAATWQGLWGKDDRKWFKCHRKRVHRLRRPYPDECPLPREKCPSFVVIRQEIKGVRRKCFFDYVGNIDYLAHDEARLHALFDMLAESRSEIKLITAMQIEEAAAPLRKAWRTAH